MCAKVSSAVLLIVLALALPGMSLAAKKDAAKPEYPVVKLASGQGMALLRVVNSRAISQFFAKYEVLVVQNVATRKRHRLVDRYLIKARHAHFVESLPPGEYEVELLESSQTGYLTLSATVRFDSTAWRFKVESGRLTNLGTLLALRPYYPANTGELRLVHAPDPGLPERSAFLFDADSRVALLGNPLGWSAIPDQSEFNTLSTATRHLSMFLAGGAAGRDGSILFGELFGQIARRRPGGAWQWEDTGSVETILAAVEATDGTMYAVAESSVLLGRNPEGSWQAIDVPVKGARPCLILLEQDHGLMMLWEQERTLTQLRYRPGSAQPWTELRKIPMASSLFSNGQPRCTAFSREQKLVILVTTPKFNSPQYALEVLDYASNEWSHHETKLYGPITAFADGSIYSMSGPNINQTFRVSRDFGKTWEVRSSPNWSGQPVFRDANVGYLLRTDDVPLATPEKLENSLWRTTDGGKSWQKQASVPNLMASLLLVPDGMLFVTSGGKMYFSADEGKTLALERDSSLTTW